MSNRLLDIEPNEQFAVEETFHEFIRSINEVIIEETLSKSPDFNNADYFFKSMQVVGELKEVKTDFLDNSLSDEKFIKLIGKLIDKEPNWKPSLFGGDSNYPSWFYHEYYRLARPPISRILKKANKQIRDTKVHLDVLDAKGVLFFVNDAFTSITPDIILSLSANLLATSYSSIDCFIYITLNRYVKIEDSQVPNLLWVPIYKENIDDEYVDFINDLGRRWFDFLEYKLELSGERLETESINLLENSRTII